MRLLVLSLLFCACGPEIGGKGGGKTNVVDGTKTSGETDGIPEYLWIEVGDSGTVAKGEAEVFSPIGMAGVRMRIGLGVLASDLIEGSVSKPYVFTVDTGEGKAAPPLLKNFEVVLNIDSLNEDLFVVLYDGEGKIVGYLDRGALRPEVKQGGTEMTFTFSGDHVSFQVVDQRPEDAPKSASPLNLPCPTGYAGVPGDSLLGTSDFCISQFEMKNMDNIFVSVADEAPYLFLRGALDVAGQGAIAACEYLGKGYSLITNEQWQTVAQNVFDQEQNWTRNEAGASVLKYGYQVGGGGNSLGFPVDLDDACAPLQQCPGEAEKTNPTSRRYILSSGEFVWDLGGNVSEHTRTDVDATDYGTLANERIPTPYEPINTTYGPRGRGPDNIYVDKSQGHEGEPSSGIGSVTSGGGDNLIVVRGGSGASSAALGGVFSLHVEWKSSDQFDTAEKGFRCVYIEGDE